MDSTLRSVEAGLCCWDAHGPLGWFPVALGQISSAAAPMRVTGAWCCLSSVVRPMGLGSVLSDPRGKSTPRFVV